MKKALPYLLLFGLLYGGWFYWQQRPRPPLRAELLPYQSRQIDRMRISRPSGAAFELFRPEDGTGGWIVENDKYSLISPEPLAEKLLTALLGIRSEGLVAISDSEDGSILSIRLTGPEVDEQLHFYAAADSFPPHTHFVSLNGLADRFRVEQLDLSSLPLSFEAYRQQKCLDLGLLPPLDSLVWWNRGDSLSYRLLERATGGDSLRLDSLQSTWSPLQAGKYAGFFNEIRDQPALLGQYVFYSVDTSRSARLEVFHDPDWPRPYVLSSSQQPTVYIAADSLPYPIDSSWLQRGETDR